MKRRLRKDIASALNTMAHQEMRRRYAALASELKTRALELVDSGMAPLQLLEAISEEFGLAGPEASALGGGPLGRQTSS